VDASNTGRGTTVLKVQVDINGLERKIAICHKRADEEGFEEGVQYQMGKADAYLDILCSYLGITDSMKMMELEDRIITQQEGK
jgi:hypothetical protein